MEKLTDFGWNQQRIERVYDYLRDVGDQLSEERRTCKNDRLAAIDDIKAGLEDVINLIHGQKDNETRNELKPADKEAAGILKNMVTIQLDLPTSFEIWMGLNELAECIPRGKRITGLHEIGELAGYFKFILHSALQSVKEFKHNPFIWTEQSQPMPEDDPLPF